MTLEPHGIAASANRLAAQAPLQRLTGPQADPERKR